MKELHTRSCLVDDCIADPLSAHPARGAARYRRRPLETAAATTEMSPTSLSVCYGLNAPLVMSGQMGLGMKMMKRLGWDGAGLGVGGKGIQEPIAAAPVRDKVTQFRVCSVKSPAHVFADRLPGSRSRRREHRSVPCIPEAEGGVSQGGWAEGAGAEVLHVRRARPPCEELPPGLVRMEICSHTK